MYSVEKRIVEHLTNSVAGINRELAHFKSGLKNLQSQVEVLVICADSENPVQGLSSTKADSDALPNINYCFSSGVCQRVISSSVNNLLGTPGQECNTSVNGDTCSTRTAICTADCLSVKFSALINAIRLGKKAIMANNVLHSGCDLEYSRIRNRLVLSLLRNVQLIRLIQFDATITSSKSPSSCNGLASQQCSQSVVSYRGKTTGIGDIMIPQPSGVGEDVVSALHV